MRCLTLGEELVRRGHEVHLLGSLGNVEWLQDELASSGIPHAQCEPDVLEIDRIVSSQFDGIVIDSYRIPSDLVSRLNSTTPCLAIIDGDSRQIEASIYLDQNMGASPIRSGAATQSTWLTGSDFTLVRDAVLKQRRNPDEARHNSPPRIVAFMGGTDPIGAIVGVTASILAQSFEADLTIVSAEPWLPQAEAMIQGRELVHVLAPTSDLPRVLGHADIVVSAAGTSAWDVCTMARPAVLVAVVANQRDSLSPIERHGVALTIDATQGSNQSLADVGPLVAKLVESPDLRYQLARRSFDVFDGKGKSRIADVIEAKWS